MWETVRTTQKEEGKKTRKEAAETTDNEDSKAYTNRTKIEAASKPDWGGKMPDKPVKKDTLTM